MTKACAFFPSMATTCMSDFVRCIRPYRALVLQAHHEGAHVSRGLVVDDDHGLLLGDGPHVVSPLRHCRTRGTRAQQRGQTHIKHINLFLRSVFETTWVASVGLRLHVTMPFSPQGKTKPLL